MSAITFATIDAALEATDLPVRLYCRIGDEIVDVHEVRTVHDVNQPIGTATVIMEAPRPAVLQMNAPLAIEGGYAGVVGPIFSGRIPNDEASIELAGSTCRVEGVGWASLLAYPEFSGVVLPGPVTLKEAFRSLCRLRNVPTYLADETLTPDGQEFTLGGNELIDDGDVVLDDRTSPLDFLTRAAVQFGYRIFDTPQGVLRLARISGLPNPKMRQISGPIEPGSSIRVRTNQNLRAAPGLSSDVLAVMPGNTRALVTGASEPADGYTWWPIDPAGHPSGWVAESPLDSTQEDFIFPVELDRPITVYAEGVNAFRFANLRDTRPMVTYWEVLGARYTDLDGGQTAIRSIPAAVPYAPELDPPGYRKQTGGDPSIIVTEAQAHIVRNVLEIDHSEVYRAEQWETMGNPFAAPGDTVNLHADTCGVIHEDRWLMRVSQTISDRGYIADMEGWAGAGTPLPAGDDCTITTIGAGPYHIGDETVSWYAAPAPQESRTFAITLPEDYSSLRVLGECHGTNSYGDGLGDFATSGSGIELWQLSDPSLPESGVNELRRVGSGQFPVHDEEFSRRRPYASSDQFWMAFSVPISGQTVAGAAELRLVAGSNEDGIDDYEVRNLRLVLCGVGVPDLPGVGA